MNNPSQAAYNNPLATLAAKSQERHIGGFASAQADEMLARLLRVCELEVIKESQHSWVAVRRLSGMLKQLIDVWEQGKTRETPLDVLEKALHAYAMGVRAPKTVFETHADVAPHDCIMCGKRHRNDCCEDHSLCAEAWAQGRSMITSKA